MTRAKAKPPKLPRAVRELLRDVVYVGRQLEEHYTGNVQQAVRGLADRAEAIVARARKAGRR